MTAPAPLIVHVIYRLDYGGLENGLVNLLNRMPATQFRHAVICLAGFSEFRQRIVRQDVEVYSLDKRPGKDLGAYVRLWRLLRRLRPDIVHTRNLGTIDMQWVAFLAGARRRVHGEHGWEVSDLTGRNAKSLRIRRACRYAIHRYVALSQDIANWLRTSVHVEPARITQIYNGADTQRFQLAGATPADLPWRDSVQSPFVFGTVGRLDPVKGQRNLLDAFAQLVEQLPERRQTLRLIIAGGGALADELRTRAASLGITELVWFPGARDDIANLMRAMDVFVLPSLNEGISNTILEAMAAGRPVIAACVGGNPELVTRDQTGALYDCNDIGALCQAMAAYVADPQRVSAHGAAGRTRVLEQFSLDGMVNNYVNLYKQLQAA